MTPLPQEKVPGLMPIFESMISEANLSGRSSPSHCMAKLYEGYAGKRMDVFVDDLEDIKHVIIFGRFPGIVTNENLAVVLFIYSVPGVHRGTPESTNAFAQKIEDYSKFWGVDAVLASDWQWRGTQMGVGAFLRRCGFERQETTYAKLVAKPVGALPAPA